MDEPGTRKRASDADPSDDHLWGIREVSEFLNVSPKTVRRWIAAGRLPVPKSMPGGRTLRWNPKKIRTWFEKLPSWRR
jgi:excisionase family DNA binding protein